MAYNISQAYLLCFFFGWLGIHHVYLGRVNHAIVWYATLGGCGVGWIRDLWRMPSYVAWATADEEYRRRHSIRMELRSYPTCSCFKSIGILVMGYLAAEVFSNIIPSLTEDDWRSSYLYSIFCSFSSKILYVVGGLTGIYLVANIGKTFCRLEGLLMGCFYSLPFVILSLGHVEWALLFVGLKARFWDLKWKELQPEDNNEMSAEARFMYDYAVYSLASMIWLSLLSTGLYLNAAVIVQEDQVWPLRHTKIQRIPLRNGMPEIKISNPFSGVKFCLTFRRYDSLLANGELTKSCYFFYYEKKHWISPYRYYIDSTLLSYRYIFNGVLSLKYDC